MLKRCLFFIALLYTATVFGEPFVIHDAGRGVSTAPYKKLFSQDDVRDFRQSWIFGDLPDADISETPAPPEVYPLKTTLLSPKRIDKPIEGYYPRMFFPVCIVGDDDLSLEWVERNRWHLAESGAQCFLVSATSAESAEPVLRLLDGIMVYPGNGDAIAQYFKVDHYPILITDRYASQ